MTKQAQYCFPLFDKELYESLFSFKATGIFGLGLALFKIDDTLFYELKQYDYHGKLKLEKLIDNLTQTRVRHKNLS